MSFVPFFLVYSWSCCGIFLNIIKLLHGTVSVVLHLQTLCVPGSLAHTHIHTVDVKILRSTVRHQRAFSCTEYVQTAQQFHANDVTHR